MASPILTLIIPTFNEAEIIIQTLDTIESKIGNNFLKKISVLLLDDGDDDLPIKISSYKSIFFDSVSVIRNNQRLGKGKSIAQGIFVNKCQIVGFIDADLSVCPRHISEAVDSILSSECDLFIGSRSMGKRFLHDQSILRSFLGLCLNICAHIPLIRYGRIHKDTQCGFKFFRNDVAKHLYRDLITHDGLTDLEILIKAARHKYRVREKDVPWISGRETKRNLGAILHKEIFSLATIIYRYTF